MNSEIDEKEVQCLALKHGLFPREVSVIWSQEDGCYIASSCVSNCKAHGETVAEAVKELSIAVDLVALYAFE